jgi:type I restriction enzyme R subunit
MSGPEFFHVEKPAIDYLVELGYRFVESSEHANLRDGDNHVLFRPHLIAAIQRINNVPEETARSVYVQLLNEHDNATWLHKIRGNLHANVAGEKTARTIRLIDFENLANNEFVVTNQLTVRGSKTRRTDVVVYVNGLPLVVIEAKKQFAEKDKSGEAFDQIRQYEAEIPRLFYCNVFNIITNRTHTLYGATGASSAHWAFWKDPWPKSTGDFSEPFFAALWSLLEPARLLDLVAHYIVFEKTEKQIIKKICRYQQFRAVNKIVERVVAGTPRRGLIWHTQGSGKSLTMVYAALKLKTHLTLRSPELENLNFLVLTDRIDLDNQISKTFVDCGLRNPQRANSVNALREFIRNGSRGLTVLSTIFKFLGSKQEIAESENWVVMVDECHRTQEKDLGAYLRATLPHARFFGFTGTPIKKTDKDTYENFGAPGEGYLDRYGIDDAVADGATVPIWYTGRLTKWQLEGRELDVLFDQWFADEDDEVIEAIKRRGVTMAELAKHGERVKLIAYDIFTHFREHALPDGLKAQIVAIDREAVVLYKEALDTVIAKWLVKTGNDPDEAKAEAARWSACVYSSQQSDQTPSEDAAKDRVRKALVANYLDEEKETAIKGEFNKAGKFPHFLIVCNKLLTGFDAPIEGVMYLDNPLKEHNLLQAIARTNRVYGRNKGKGLIVDYIGVSDHLAQALSTYRSADVENAMRSLDEPRQELAAAHRAVMEFLKGVARSGDKSREREEYQALMQALGTEDAWFSYSRKAKGFIAAYSWLSPDPEILKYQDDLRWVVGSLSYGRMTFEKKEGNPLTDYSAKIREMLAEHLHVTGLAITCKARGVTDPDFWEDFKWEGKSPQQLHEAAIRKNTELNKIAREKVAENPLRYESFSQRVQELIEKFQKGQLDIADLLQEQEKLMKAFAAEERAHQDSKLSAVAYGVYRILEAFKAKAPGPTTGAVNADGSSRAAEASEVSPDPGPTGLTGLEKVAAEIDEVYGSDDSAPPGWHLKEALRKELRSKVRRIVHGQAFENWKDIPTHVEEYALKHYLKT